MTPPNPVVPNTAVMNIDSLLNNLAGIDRIVSFGEDAIGRLYLVDLNGEVYRILTTPSPGDFNADGIVDDVDIDMLASAAEDDPDNAFFDLNGNGILEFEPTDPPVPPDPNYNPTDSDILVRELVQTNRNGEAGIGTQYGDLNLDGKVDGLDFSTLLGNFGVGSDWSSGDITGDMAVTGADFSRLLGAFGFSNASGTSLSVSVPEPTTGLLFLPTALWLTARRFRHQVAYCRNV